MISSETGNVPRVEFNQSYDFEHQVLRDFSTDPMPSSVELDESGMLEMQRYTQLGHEREAVIMALLAVTASEDKDSQVLYTTRIVVLFQIHSSPTQRPVQLELNCIELDQRMKCIPTTCLLGTEVYRRVWQPEGNGLCTRCSHRSHDRLPQ